MAVKQVGPLAAVTNSAPKILGTQDCGARYVAVLGFLARNWASSAKAGAGTDVLETVELKDADGIIFYLDAADRDYATAAKKYYINQDDTITGLGVVPVDATGAVLTAGSLAGAPVVKSPVTVTIRNCGTATDYFEISLIVDTLRGIS